MIGPEASPFAARADRRIPLLMLHGRNDPIAPVSQARRFREALDEAEARAYEYHELEGGHGGYDDRSQQVEVRGLTVDFLERRL